MTRQQAESESGLNWPCMHLLGCKPYTWQEKALSRLRYRYFEKNVYQKNIPTYLRLQNVTNNLQDHQQSPRIRKPILALTIFHPASFNKQCYIQGNSLHIVNSLIGNAFHLVSIEPGQIFKCLESMCPELQKAEEVEITLHRMFYKSLCPSVCYPSLCGLEPCKLETSGQRAYG